MHVYLSGKGVIAVSQKHLVKLNATKMTEDTGALSPG